MMRPGNLRSSATSPPSRLPSARLDLEVDLDHVLRAAVDEVAHVLGADRATLYLVDRALGELVGRVAHLPELSEIRLRMGEGVAGWVARTGEVVNSRRGIDDPRFAARIDGVTGYRTENLLSAPIRAAGDDVIGVLQVLNRKGGGDFDLGDERNLVVLAAELAATLDASSLRSQLRPDQRLPLSFRFNRIIGDSVAMRGVIQLIERAALSDAAVLVRGERGSGKDAIARAIHYNSSRQLRPFVKLECAMGATFEDGAGLAAAVRGGTLCLDEIAELSPAAQARLLELLETAGDVRVIATTSQDLEALAFDGRVRRDLLARLRVIEMALPPLRARGPVDLDRLIDHFLYEHMLRHQRPGLGLTPRARQSLHLHDWPGNLAELDRALESAVVVTPSLLIEPAHLRLGCSTPRPAVAKAASAISDVFVSPIQSLREVERGYIQHVVDVCEGNRSEASRRLGIGRNTLLRKLQG